MHSPLTAIFLIAEITGGYVLFIPLMIVVAISYIISRMFNPHNMYWSELIHEKKINPDQDYFMLNEISIDSLINKNYLPINKDMTLRDFYKLLEGNNANIFPVLTKNNMLEGVVWIDQIRKHMFDPEIDNITVGEIMVLPPATIDYYQPVNIVMETFDAVDAWQLPVVREEHFVGLISKSTLLAKYREVFIQRNKESDLFSH